MPAVPGSATCCRASSAATPPRLSVSSRAATWSCRSCAITAGGTSSRTPMGASSSPFPTRPISPSSARPIRTIPANRRPAAPAPPSRPRLWHADRASPRRHHFRSRPRPALRLQPHRDRGPLSDARGMGGGCGRRAVAPQQARPPPQRRRGRRARRLHERKAKPRGRDGEDGVAMSLTLDNVSKIVGSETHISGISMTLEKGTINVLLGGTLSGKTSLIRLMARLHHPRNARILADGRDVTGMRVRDRKVAMGYQQFINYPTLTVYENIAAPLRVARLPRAEIERRVQDAARLLRLETMLDRLPLQLSGGQQQRTAIARALVKGADLVLMDEPLANLDYKLREELREELPRVFGVSGAVFVYATTEPSEALLLGGNTATLFER